MAGERCTLRWRRSSTVANRITFVFRSHTAWWSCGLIRLTSSFENLSSAGTPHGLIDVMTMDHTGEDENGIATRNNACARYFHVQEVGGSFPK